MPQAFSDVYANVLDFGARAEPTTTSPVVNTRSINAAITSGREGVFPAGTYRFAGVIRFATEGQRSRFTAGAILEPAGTDSYVLVTGADQVIEGLRIEVPSTLEARSPVLDIYAAGGATLRDLQISVPAIAKPSVGPKAAVRVMYLTRCSFVGGEIVSSTGEGVGLWLASSYDYDYSNDPNPTPGEWTWGVSYLRPKQRGDARDSSGAYEVSASGLAIQGFAWAVRIGCIADNPAFLYCGFFDNTEGSLVVCGDADVRGEERHSDGMAKGLTLLGCRFSGGDIRHYVKVEEGSSVMGGTVVACSFGGGDLDLADAGGSGLPTPPKFGVRVPVPKRVPIGANSVGSTKPQAGVRVAAASPPTKARPAIRPAGSVRVPAMGGLGGAFGGLGGADPEPPAGLGGFEPDPFASGCIFYIAGIAYGVVVTGCSSTAWALRKTVWQLPDSAGVTSTCDFFNNWAEAVVATGSRSNYLVQFGGQAEGALTIKASSLSLTAETSTGLGTIGFFDAPGITQPAAYTLGTVLSRDAASGDVREVLTQLLTDLAALGLVTKA